VSSKCDFKGIANGCSGVPGLAVEPTVQDLPDSQPEIASDDSPLEYFVGRSFRPRLRHRWALLP
jgi:hypothetical protein